MRAGTGSVALLAVLAITLTAALEARDARRHPAPGELVPLADGRQLHLQVAGGHHTGPTVVLEAGHGGYSPVFGWLQAHIAEYATVVAYDRPGYGWSDPDDRPVDAAATAADLREALHALELDGPYVLVGHSLGAMYTRTFAHDYPDDVTAMVLLDPAHARQLDQLSAETVQRMQQANRTLALAPHLARLGLFRLYQPQADVLEALPDAAATHMRATATTPRTLRAAAREGSAFRDLADAVANDPAGMPLAVISASVADPGWAELRVVQDALDRELVERNPSADHHVVTGADHFTLLTDPAHARTVADVIAQLAGGNGP